ncbi:thiamine phosphate synthase [Candidatus Synechococcus calcipolaris G9]|uniref:Thiamine-phosphate synthase n=1 Tax=Candidatus Synechococcus calcipolaris G9 TaxID=1497997 RepID=A0ABT6F0B2_9SYNE|nr:thiamine phosphate synthase [Candidatus Synechococcus calcipolaris]MDG2991299.1 thiamine phosphate synthase [Candidatus Synechococcus calcipolaris G9]
MQDLGTFHPKQDGDSLGIVHRILDANLDRAREGLRVVEEWCRLGLEHSQLTAECKALRQELGGWHRQELRAARQTSTDVGTHLSHPQEEERSHLAQLLQANLCRVQEALRVIEEYAKLSTPPLAIAAKSMRYRVYILESQLLDQALEQAIAPLNPRLNQLRQTPLYLVTSPHDHLIQIVEAALEGGLKLVQHRDKTNDDQTRLDLGRRLRKLCDRHEALLIVNDRADIALGVEADGVHLGQTDISLALARQILGPHRLIGRSTTNPTELNRAISEGADYIGVGPVYATPTKPGKAAAGLDYIRYALAQTPIPQFAIGGIDHTNLQDVLAAGAKQVAVVRAIMEASDVKVATQQLLYQL